MSPEDNYRRFQACQESQRGKDLSLTGYANYIEAKITELEPTPRKPFGILDYIGLSVVGLIVIGTGVGVTAAIQHEKEIAERPKVQAPMPHGYRIIDMPGQQVDVVTFCDAGNRVYKDAGGTKGEAISVIHNDPTCAGS